MREANSKQLTKDAKVRFTPEQYEAVKALARQEDRDIGNMIRTLVNEAMKARGAK